jgi:DNA-binding transcriptional ArsR family regulator
VFENSPVIDLAVGRSSVRQRILALLMNADDGRLHLREIQRRASTSPGTASRELTKLVAAGLIVREAEGNQVYFRASATPLATMLRTLLVAIPASETGPRPRRLARTKSSTASVATSAAEPDATTTTAERLEEAPATPRPAAPEPTPRILRPQPVAQAPTASPTEIEAEAPPVAATPASGASAGPDVPTAAPPTALPSATGPAGSTAGAVRPASPDPEGMQIAGRLAESIRSMYGDAVRGIYLYGARAAGPAPATDVETIIVLDHVDQYGVELERTSHLYAALSHELDLVASRIFVTEADWDGRSEGTWPQIRAEAVAV